MDESGILSEILEEYLARLRKGEEPDLEEYARRHPELATRIRELLPTAGLMERLAHRNEETARDLFARNPYVSRLMIEEPSRFFGRQRELARIFSRIGSHRPQSVSIVGERRIGKSSLLKALTWPDTRRRFLSQPEVPLCIFIDLQQLPGLTRDGFFDLLLARIREKAGLEVPAGGSPYQRVQEILSSLRQRELPLILLLDEFDSLTQNPEFDSDFFAFLRSCANNYPVGFVTSSRDELQRLCHSSAIADSPFFNIFSSLYLKGFTAEEADQLILVPSREAGIPLASWRDSILDLGGRFPFYLQIACSVYFEQLSSDPGRATAEEMREAFLEEAAPHMSYFWDRRKLQEREVLREICAGRQPDPELVFWCKALERSGYLVREEGRYRAFSEAFSHQVGLLDSLPGRQTATGTLAGQDSLSELKGGQELQQYRILRQIGQGGMGVVYLAEDRSLCRRVVLKLCRPERLYNPVVRRRALREARTAAALRHPGIAGIYELLDYHGLPVLVMEYVEGSSMASYLQEQGRLHWRKLCEWGIQICGALAHAHEQGLVHRDIKPSNVMISSEGQAKLTDFGLAKWQVEPDFDVQLTASRAVLGTVNYMSPEQARGEEVDARSDLFSLGVLFFEALTGTLPFVRGDLPSSLQAILHDPLPSLGLYEVENASRLDPVLQKLCAKPQEARFQSARELGHRLEQLLKGTRGWRSHLRLPWDSSSEGSR